ncbi:unnamed protein product [Linum tenue]|uniref:Uncharacterized protein n=1 Tax=Linum tenue TaxID=586396 RepID=A0AAV0LAU1_9ROSI|nr:unnamed protein product [Linum tenue]
MVNMDHPYLVALRSITEMEREAYFWASLRFFRLHCGDFMREAVVHPQ